MTSLRATALAGTLAMLLATATGPPLNASSRGGNRQVLSLDFRNNGQYVKAWVGQQIEISLATVGPGQYGPPEISSSAVRLLDIAQNWPPNPGSQGFIYVLEAAAEGEARVAVPVLNAEPMHCTNGTTFTVTIRVRPAGGRAPALQSMLRPDQANTTPWRNAWTNLNNFARQTFVPSLPRLTGVEVELVAANPGPESAEVSLMILKEDGFGVARVSKIVSAAECRRVVFVLPRGGLRVAPGQVYSLTLSGGDNLFGWKYVVGGYGQGAAWFNNKPLLKDARSTFLFRTFGGS